MAGQPRPFLGLLAGAAAGLVAAAALTALRPKPETEDHETLPTPAGGDRAARYVVGAVTGAIYGVLAEYRPEASAGFDATYGLAAAALIDEVLPEAGDEPAEPGPEQFVFGLIFAGVRALIAGRRG